MFLFCGVCGFTSKLSSMVTNTSMARKQYISIYIYIARKHSLSIYIRNISMFLFCCVCGFTSKVKTKFHGNKYKYS
jgi:hypothetical protein